MKRFLIYTLAALTVGLLGSCSKINERIDKLDRRVDGIEQEKIASIGNQIAGINAAIADLGTIRKDILDLQVAVGAKGEDISELKAADEALGKRIDELKSYVGDLSKYAEEDWVSATFATLEQLNAAESLLHELNVKIDKFFDIMEDGLSKLETDITDSINTAIKRVKSSISSLASRVSALEQMIQSVTIIPAYSDGSVKAEEGILTIDCVISPKKAVYSLKKENFTIFTKVGTTSGKLYIADEGSLDINEANGTASIRVDVSSILPTEFSVALNVKNGISDYITEFVGVTTVVPTFKAVYDTNDEANTLTFYYDTVDHSGEGIVYEGSTGEYYLFDGTKSSVNLWGYNQNNQNKGVVANIKSVVIDASVAGYSYLKSTAYMFQGMTAASDISGAEYLDVSNVTDMSLMFMNFGGGSKNSPTTLNSVPDVSNWNTSKVTNMQGMFNSYGNFSECLTKVPDVSNWNTSKVTNMSNMFQKYGHESNNLNEVPDVSGWNTEIVTNMSNMFNEYGYSSAALTKVPDVSGWSTANLENLGSMFQNYGGLKSGSTTVESNVEFTLDLSGWDLTKLEENKGSNLFNLKPNTFNVTIPAKTGEKPNETGKWYYGDGTNYIVPASGKSFTLAKTVEDILPDDFPTYMSEYEDYWKNNSNEQFTMHKEYDDIGDYLLAGDVSDNRESNKKKLYLNRVLTKVDDNTYTYAESGVTWTFNLTAGVLKSVILTGEGPFAGTYAPAATGNSNVFTYQAGTTLDFTNNKYGNQVIASGNPIVINGITGNLSITGDATDREIHAFVQSGGSVTSENSNGTIKAYIGGSEDAQGTITAGTDAVTVGETGITGADEIIANTTGKITVGTVSLATKIDLNKVNADIVITTPIGPTIEQTQVLILYNLFIDANKDDKISCVVADNVKKVRGTDGSDIISMAGNNSTNLTEIDISDGVGNDTVIVNTDLWKCDLNNLCKYKIELKAGDKVKIDNVDSFRSSTKYVECIDETAINSAISDDTGSNLHFFTFNSSSDGETHKYLVYDKDNSKVLSDGDIVIEIDGANSITNVESGYITFGE